MRIHFEPLSGKHREEVIAIYNHYIENSFAAYPDQPVPDAFFDRFLEMTCGYPAFAMQDDMKTVGFCFLRPYSPFPTFSECAEITYFIDQEHTGQGIGATALGKLELEAHNMGIKTLLAHIASENPKSIDFHRRHGFRECGRFENIIHKNNKRFDIVWMQKNIQIID